MAYRFLGCQRYALLAVMASAAVIAAPAGGRDRDPTATPAEASSATSEYRRDPRIEGMLDHNASRVRAQWHARRGSDDVPASLKTLFLPHAGGDAGEARWQVEPPSRSAPKAQATIEVKLRHATSGAPVGNFIVWIGSEGGQHVYHVGAEGEMHLQAPVGETLAVHLAPDAPLALQQVMLDVVPGTTEYTIELHEGEPVELRLQEDGAPLAESVPLVYMVGRHSPFLRSTDATGVDRIALPAGVAGSVEPMLPAPYHLRDGVHAFGASRGDIVVPLERLVPTTLALGAPARVTVVKETSGRLLGRHSSDTTTLQALLPRDVPVRLLIEPVAPWLGRELRGVRVDAASTIDVALQSGVALTLDARNSDGVATAVDVVVATTDGRRRQHLGVGGTVPVAVPAGEPVLLDIVSPASLPVQLRDTFTADRSVAVTLPARNQLSGTGVHGGAPATHGVRVEAWRAGERTGSDLINPQYRLHLPSGDYELRWFSEGWHSPVLPEASAPVTLVDGGSTRDIELAAADGRLRLQVPEATACAAVDDAVATLRFEADGFRPSIRLIRLAETDDVFRSVAAAAGRYRLAIDLPGYPTWRSDAFDIASGADTVLDLRAMADDCQVWRGTLRGPDGAAIDDQPIELFSAAQELVGTVTTDADGRFTVPVSDGMLAEFQAPERGEALREVRMLARGSGDIEADLQLRSLSWAGELRPLEAVPQLVYGDAADTGRFNLVFMAEGYVRAQETFEDSNGNGRWDGVQWIDLDADGVWDGHREPFAVHGEAPQPQLSQAGTDIGAENEPFDDRNGDGYPSIDDVAVFERNVRDFMRELLSLPFWYERRNAINAWALWYDSAQAGQDVIGRNGEAVMTRDTVFDAQWRLDGQRSGFGIDYFNAEAQVAAAMPSYGTKVVLVNQPVPVGAANAFVLYNGGATGRGRNARIGSHELGHAIGALADEYETFSGDNFTLGEPVAPNMTKFADPQFGRWNALIAGEPALHDGEAGIGWIDGGNYVRGGIYRPTANSTMRYGSPLFNAPSLAALRTETCHRMASCVDAAALRSGAWWVPDESGWGLFTFDQGSVLATTWFTYDDDGEPAWYLLPLRPRHDGAYHGDVLRLTGPSFRQHGEAADPAVVVGSARLAFEQDGTVFDYVFDGVTQRKQLEPFRFGSMALACQAADRPSRAMAGNYSDLWWNPAESGWGLFVIHLEQRMFAVWYTYDVDGEPLFMIADVAQASDGSFTGPIHRSRNGVPLLQIDGQPASPGADVVGTATLRFATGDSGRLVHTIDGVTVERPIERLQVGDVASECRSMPVD